MRDTGERAAAASRAALHARGGPPTPTNPARCAPLRRGGPPREPEKDMATHLRGGGPLTASSPEAAVAAQPKLALRARRLRCRLSSQPAHCATQRCSSARA